MKRGLLIFAGWICVGLAAVGAVLPLIPCTPFLLLAVACFARSSTRSMNRLRRSPLLGPVLRDWQRHRGMRLSAKFTAAIVGIAAPLITLAIHQQLGVPFFISLLGGSVALAVVFRLPTVKPQKPLAVRKAKVPPKKKLRIAA